MIWHLDRKTWKWVKGPAPTSERPERRVARASDGGGISFQFPKGYDDGSGKLQYVKDGIHKGRVFFRNRAEAREIAARYEGLSGQRTRFDPS